MTRSETTAFVLGTLAAAFWSPHFYLVQAQHGQSSLLVFYFYVLLAAAVVCLLLLALMGQTRELSEVARRESHFIFLALTGGYGLWLLRALALDHSAADPARAHLLFYLGPLILIVAAKFTRFPPSGRQMLGVVLGFVGAALIIGKPATPTGLGAVLLAVGAAVCWALFAMAGAPVAKEEKVLPMNALVWTVGAACLLVTCMSTGESPFQITRKEFLTAILLGVVTLALGFGCWFKCLATSSKATAGAFWYVALVFGIGWHGSIGRGVSFWTLGGVLLLLVAVRCSLGSAKQRDSSISDMIRG